MSKSPIDVMVKKVFLFLCLALSVQTVLSQNQTPVPKGNGRVVGVVMDSLLKAPVEFANVALIDHQTKKPIDGAVCDEKGRFSITKVAVGKYQLVVSFIGYESKEIDVYLSDKINEMDLGSIQISPSTEVLAEVVVEGEKIMVEEKVDRTIYNAENDMTTKGGDATDVLKRVPLLSVDIDGNVSLRGSSSVKVLINNKPSTITATSVADALKQIPADMIKTVEVITSPSSKYDAEGSAGIINIILKKNTLEGLFLTADGTAGTRGSNLSLNVNYRNGKMGFSFGAFGRNIYNVHGKFVNDQQTYSDLDTVLNIQRATTRNHGTNSQYTFGWDYDINKFNSLTASLRYGKQDQMGYQDQLYTERYSTIDPDAYSLKNIRTTNVSGNMDASLTYTKSFVKKDREFNFLGIFSQNNPNTGFITDEISLVDYSVLKSYKNVNKGHTQEVTLQADFQEPIRANQLIEFGAKDVMRTVSSQYQYFLSEGSTGEYESLVDPQLSNNFNYDQNVTAGYVSYTLTASAFTLKTGGRYEYTNINAHYEGQPDINIPSYGVLVPSLNVSRKLKNGNLIKASYNRRIQRPSLRDLNPNIQGSNPLNISVGNPNLKPEYTDNYGLAYSTSYKIATIDLSTYVRYNTNDIQSARNVRGDTIVSTVQNIGSEGNYGASVFLNLPFSKKFSLSGSADLYYRILKNNSPDPFINATNQGLVQNYRLSGSYKFSRDWSFQFFSFFQGRNINLQGYRTNPISHSLAVKKDFTSRKGSIGLGIDNFVTPSYQVHSYLSSAYLDQTTTNTLYNFVAKVNFSYKIGKKAPERKAKKSLEEDTGS